MLLLLLPFPPAIPETPISKHSNVPRRANDPAQKDTDTVRAKKKVWRTRFDSISCKCSAESIQLIWEARDTPPADTSKGASSLNNKTVVSRQSLFPYGRDGNRIISRAQEGCITLANRSLSLICRCMVYHSLITQRTAHDHRHSRMSRYCWLISRPRSVPSRRRPRFRGACRIP